MKKIVLIGFATSYKSSVGKLLADKLNAKFVDTDVEIENYCKLSIQQIFDSYGEAYFRKIENQILSNIVKRQNTVVACGGGSVLAKSFEQLAKNSVVIWLTVTAQTVTRRLGGTPRPLFDKLNEQELATALDSRAELYRRYADVVLPTDNLTSEQVAEKLLLKLKSIE